MTIFGFAKEKKEGVPIDEFFRKNLAGFAPFYGLEPADTDFRILSADDPRQLIIDSGISLEACSEDGPLHILKRPQKPILRVHLNSRVIDEIAGEKDAATATKMLWHTFIKCNRTWVQRVSRISLGELLPASLVYRFSDGETVYEALNRQYVKDDWTINQLRRRYDATIVAHYISTLIAVDPNGTDRFDEEKIASIIIRIRRSNWEQFMHVF